MGRPARQRSVSKKSIHWHVSARTASDDRYPMAPQPVCARHLLAYTWATKRAAVFLSQRCAGWRTRVSPGVGGRPRTGRESGLAPSGRRVRLGRRATPEGLQAGMDGPVCWAEPGLTFQTPNKDASRKGHKTGGAMAADGLPHLLRVIGDHGRCVRDGRFQPDAPVSPLGRLLRLEPATGVAPILTRGPSQSM